MRKYLINYHTGAGNLIIDGALEEAMIEADEGAAYTQTDYDVCDPENPDKVYAVRRWWGVKYNDNPEDNDVLEQDPICFGDYGYYSDWEMTDDEQEVKG